MILRVGRRARRNHRPAFKAKGALAAITGEQALIELAQDVDVHPNRLRLLDHNCVMETRSEPPRNFVKSIRDASHDWYVAELQVSLPYDQKGKLLGLMGEYVLVEAMRVHAQDDS